jgi:hypothetical protein
MVSKKRNQRLFQTYGMEGRERMGRYNGKGPNYCKNCGGGEGIHKADDMACPANGVDQTGSQFPRYAKGIYFDPQEWERDIENGVANVGKTLFDEYFIAAIQGLSVSLSGVEGINPDDVNLDRFVSFAFNIATAAVKKRNEYKAVGK